MELLQDSANELWRDIFYWNSKGHFQGQVWLIFTYFSLLISSIEMLAKYSACSFSNVSNDKMDDKNVQNSLCITSMKQKLSGPIEAHGPFIYLCRGIVCKNLPISAARPCQCSLHACRYPPGFVNTHYFIHHMFCIYCTMMYLCRALITSIRVIYRDVFDQI